MKTLKLCLPLETFDKLHEAADGRKGACKVQKDDLQALLIDHSKILAALADMDVPIEEDYSNHTKVRQAG